MGENLDHNIWKNGILTSHSWEPLVATKVRPEGGIVYDDGYGFDLECVAQSNFQKVVDSEPGLWNLRRGPRHGGDLGDEYAYGVAFFDLADVNCGFPPFSYFHPSCRSRRRYGGPQETADADESLVNHGGIGSRGPWMLSSSQYLCHSDFRVSDGNRLRLRGASLVFHRT